MTFIRRASLEDAEYLAPRLRQADVAELQAGCGSSPLEALTESVRLSSEAFTAGVEGEPIIMFGVAPIIPGKLGGAWMLSSDKIYDHIRPFLRQSKDVLDRLNTTWPVMFNYCDERNEDHIKWMLWLDYTFIARHERFGVEKRPFLEFVRVKPNVRTSARHRELRRKRRLVGGGLHGPAAGG